MTKLAITVGGLLLTLGLFNAGGALAAPASSAGASLATMRSDPLVAEAVTRAGVAHRSVRRTARRVDRRHP